MARKDWNMQENLIKFDRKSKFWALPPFISTASPLEALRSRWPSHPQLLSHHDSNSAWHLICVLGRDMIITAPQPWYWELCAFKSLKCGSDDAASMNSVALYWNQRERERETVGGKSILFKQRLWVADSLQKPLIDCYCREALTQSRAW